MYLVHNFPHCCVLDTKVNRLLLTVMISGIPMLYCGGDVICTWRSYHYNVVRCLADISYKWVGLLVLCLLSWIEIVGKKVNT